MKKVGILDFNKETWITIAASFMHTHSIDNENHFHISYWNDCIKILYGEDFVDRVLWVRPPEYGSEHYEMKYLSTVDLNVVNNCLIHQKEERNRIIEEAKAKIAKKDKELVVGYDAKWVPIEISQSPNTFYVPEETVDPHTGTVIVSPTVRQQETFQWASWFHQDR
jgi:hypothetical protein